MIIHRILGGVQDLLLKGWENATTAKDTKATQQRGNNSVEVNYLNIDTIPYKGQLGDPDYKSIRDYIDENSGGGGGTRTELTQYTFTNGDAVTSQSLDDFTIYDDANDVARFKVAIVNNKLELYDKDDVLRFRSQIDVGVNGTQAEITSIIINGVTIGERDVSSYGSNEWVVEAPNLVHPQFDAGSYKHKKFDVVVAEWGDN